MSHSSSLTPATITALRAHFDHDQLLELTLDVMKWNYQKVAVALGVDDEVRPGSLVDLAFDANGDPVF